MATYIPYLNYLNHLFSYLLLLTFRFSPDDLEYCRRDPVACFLLLFTFCAINLAEEKTLEGLSVP